MKLAVIGSEATPLSKQDFAKSRNLASITSKLQWPLLIIISLQYLAASLSDAASIYLFSK
jgi:hypothetical protein